MAISAYGIIIATHDFMILITTLRTDKWLFILTNKLKNMFGMVYSLGYIDVNQGHFYMMIYPIILLSYISGNDSSFLHSCATRMMETQVTRLGGPWRKPPRTVARDQTSKKQVSWERTWVVVSYIYLHCSFLVTTQKYTELKQNVLCQ